MQDEKKLPSENCPVHYIPMEFVENIYSDNARPDSLPWAIKYKCNVCGFHWTTEGFTFWNDQPARKVKIEKIPEVGDRYTDVIKPA